VCFRCALSRARAEEEDVSFAFPAILNSGVFFFFRCANDLI